MKGDMTETALSQEALASLISSEIQLFSFGNYGMADVDEVKNEAWLGDLAWNIAASLRERGLVTSGPQEGGCGCDGFGGCCG
jgi:hypothetical protein